MKRGAEQKKVYVLLSGILFVFFSAAFTACSFDYGTGQESDKNRPDIVMENLEYVRVRGGDPIVRFQAEYAERWEERQTMELRNFSFEQMEDRGGTVNATGKAGSAEVQLASGNISLKSGVEISIDSEDITMRTAGLDWKDQEKILTGGDNTEVDIERSDGTSFSGRGFSSDVRSRSWNFTGEVKGRYVEAEDEEEAGEAPAGREEIPPDSQTAKTPDSTEPLSEDK